MYVKSLSSEFNSFVSTRECSHSNLISSIKFCILKYINLPFFCLGGRFEIVTEVQDGQVITRLVIDPLTSHDAFSR